MTCLNCHKHQAQQRGDERMRGTVLYGPGDIRFEDRETPKIVEPTDAIIRTLTCVCRSDPHGCSRRGALGAARHAGAMTTRSRTGRAWAIAAASEPPPPAAPAKSKPTTRAAVISTCSPMGRFRTVVAATPAKASRRGGPRPPLPPARTPVGEPDAATSAKSTPPPAGGRKSDACSSRRPE